MERQCSAKRMQMPRCVTGCPPRRVRNLLPGWRRPPLRGDPTLLRLGRTGRKQMRVELCICRRPAALGSWKPHSWRLPSSRPRWCAPQPLDSLPVENIIAAERDPPPIRQEIMHRTGLSLFDVEIPGVHVVRTSNQEDFVEAGQGIVAATAKRFEKQPSEKRAVNEGCRDPQERERNPRLVSQP